MAPYKRVLIKLSGEFLAGNAKHGLNGQILEQVTDTIAGIVRRGVEIALVVGGGNFFRGIQGLDSGIDRVDGDYMGMTATVMNAVALKDFFVRAGQPARVMSALKVEKLTEPLYPPKARQALSQGDVVIFAGGTGNPYFTTDTAGVLRALEIRADVMLKATRVDGVYDSDPEQNPEARKFDRLTYAEALEKRLKVMDATAFALAMEYGMPIVVFNLNRPGVLEDIILKGKNPGTIIH
ncbi:MAG: UMP kinase [Chlorobi bacterium]|nr:UMP kinase [Chlorobiota bacterium]